MFSLVEHREHIACSHACGWVGRVGVAVEVVETGGFGPQISHLDRNSGGECAPYRSHFERLHLAWFVFLNGFCCDVCFVARNAVPYISPADQCTLLAAEYDHPRIFSEANGGICRGPCRAGWGYDFTQPNPFCQIFNGTATNVVPVAEERLQRVERLKRQEVVVDPDGKRRVWNPFKKEYVVVVEN